MITNQQAGLCTIFQNNQYTAVHHEVDICAEDVHQLNRLLHDYILRNVEDNAILCKSCVESCHTVF